MNDRLRHLLVPLALLAPLALPVGALASPADVVRDCAEDGALDGSYSDAEQRAALDQIPADLDEYSDCRDVIAAAIGVGSGGGKVTAGASSARSSGRAGPKSPAARRAAARRSRQIHAARRAPARRARERELGARTVDPGDAGVFKAATTANGMPLPLTLALVALAILTLTGTLLAVWRRNPAFVGSIRRVASRRFGR